MKKNFLVIGIVLPLMCLLGGCGASITKKSKIDSVFPADDLSAEQIAKSVEKVKIMKGLVAAKYSKQAIDISATIGLERGENFVRGNYEFIDSSSQGMFLGAKINGEWKLVYAGDGNYTCSSVAEYNFPSDMIEGCNK